MLISTSQITFREIIAIFGHPVRKSIFFFAFLNLLVIFERAHATGDGPFFCFQFKVDKCVAVQIFFEPPKTEIWYFSSISRGMRYTHIFMKSSNTLRNERQ
jgi:capsule polysaccharide export protein KpsC/LpsZ